MEGILNLLRKLGYSENEIKTVLNKVPVEQQGIMGTNVATGIFSKPKKGELAKDFLVSDVIGNPFEIDYYKGRSKEDILTSASAQLKMIDDEFTKLTDQIINKNLQLTQEQRINFARNLEAKRRFEKDFEAFKTKPEAEVLDIETGKKVGDIETLKEKSGLVAPPTTDLGRIDLRNKQMLQKADEFFKSQEEVEKAEAKRQALIAKQYEGKGYEGGVFGPSGMYRSVARNFLLDQNAKGKIKLTDDVIKNLEERNYISGGQPLMYPDPIRIMRLHYGDDVFEKIPLDKIKTGAPSEITEEMSKININPVKVEAPATPGGYMTPGEIQANIEELENIERMIKRRESRFADMTDEQIKNELEHYGSQKNAFEIAFGYDHPKEYEEYLKLKNLEDPKKFAKGGSVESKGLDYLTGMEPSKGYANDGRINFEKGSIPKMLKFLIDKLADEKDFNRKLLERSNPKAVQDLYIEKYGKLPSAEEIKDIVNKQLQNKGSMEVMNPKTGEVTIPKEPVKVTEEPRTLGGLPIDERSANISDEIDKLRASGINSLENEKKLNRLSLEFVDSLDPRRQKKALDYRRESLDTENKLIIKAEEEGLDFNTYEKLRQGLYGLGKQKTLNFIKTGKVDLEPLKPVTTFEEAQKRFKTAAKAADEIFPDYNQPKTAASSLAEVMAEQKYGKVFDDISGDKQQELYEEAYNYITSINKLPKQSPAIIPEQVLEAEMNRVLNQYDKSMFIKNDQGMVDVANPENVRKMALLLKRDHPELYRRLEGGAQTNILEDFDVTGREPNANGGRIGYADGSNDAPSITLDSHKDNRLGPEDPLSKYKSYSELELLGNIEAKKPNFEIPENTILNVMPEYKPKDVVPKGAVPTMPSEEYLRRRYQLDLAKGGSVGLGYLMGE
jgi:hypothetical protein